ncbi:hypothetical protein KVT40_009275 [Elsinoe batatas]|uniref:Uncharacterized protein n=1 Tax=Elsinoe batatas TaxID=2601811 RepID=A0A8K0KU32_9PEZI|nr:hypothetical protein KVT40_009275 [Elsinoe batatas]
MSTRSSRRRTTHRIPLVEDVEVQPTPRQSQQCWARRHFQGICVWIIAITLSIGFGIVIGLAIPRALFGHTRAPKSPPKTHFCGNTSAEAIAAGCTWDQLTWAWYPPHCPHYANEEFVAADDWKFFSDPWGTEANSSMWDRGLNNQVQLFSRHGEHLTHCVYLLLSMGQIVRDGTPATPKLRNYEHLEHCVEMLMPVVRADANYSMINTKTPAVPYQEYC